MTTTLVPRIEAAAGRGGTCTFVLGGGAEPVSWAELHDDARRMAAGLQSRGLAAGDHVGLVGPTTRHLVTAIQAVWLAGGTVVVLPLPMRMGSIEEFVAQTRRRIAHADIALVAIDPQLAPFVEPQPGDPPQVSLDELARASGQADPVDEDPERLAILQYTSGSTSDPKGVMLPHRVVTANLDGLCRTGELDVDDDVLVSWLPLYHDMGLVGLLITAMNSGCDLVLGAPQDFMASPARWMQWLSDYGGTVTAGPNFSWVLAARALRRLDGLDLSRLRLAINGAEPVNPETVEAFVEAGARHGLRPGAPFPAFGMAELAIAGTFPEPLSGLRTDDVDLRVLETERYAAPSPADRPGTRRLAKLGRPVPGLDIRVVDPESGRARLDREVGELQLRGTSVTTGYYRRPDATAAAFAEGGWLRTGDLAYLLDGELVMCGRIKDVIILAGRKVFPEDIEEAVSSVDGVRAGNVIAFGVDTDRNVQSVVVVAETKADDARRDEVRRQVSERVRDAAGVAAKDVVLVAPGSLPKTSSGKLQRSLCRQRYGEQQLLPA